MPPASRNSAASAYRRQHHHPAVWYEVAPGPQRRHGADTRSSLIDGVVRFERKSNALQGQRLSAADQGNERCLKRFGMTAAHAGPFFPVDALARAPSVQHRIPQHRSVTRPSLNTAMAIWDKLKTELDRAGKAAQNALDEEEDPPRGIQNARLPTRRRRHRLRRVSTPSSRGTTSMPRRTRAWAATQPTHETEPRGSEQLRTSARQGTSSGESRGTTTTAYVGFRAAVLAGFTTARRTFPRSPSAPSPFSTSL